MAEAVLDPKERMFGKKELESFLWVTVTVFLESQGYSPVEGIWKEFLDVGFPAEEAVDLVQKIRQYIYALGQGVLEAEKRRSQLAAHPHREVSGSFVFRVVCVLGRIEWVARSCRVLVTALWESDCFSAYLVCLRESAEFSRRGRRKNRVRRQRAGGDASAFSAFRVVKRVRVGQNRTRSGITGVVGVVRVSLENRLGEEMGTRGERLKRS